MPTSERRVISWTAIKYRCSDRFEADILDGHQNSSITQVQVTFLSILPSPNSPKILPSPHFPHPSKSNTTTPLCIPTNIRPPPPPHRIIPAQPSSRLMLRPPWPPTVNDTNNTKPETYENRRDEDNCPKDWIMVCR